MKFLEIPILTLADFGDFLDLIIFWIVRIRGIIIKNTPPLVTDLGQTRGVFLLNGLSGTHPYVKKAYDL